MKHHYRPFPADRLPSDIRWDVPGHNQGQIVEVAYADYPTQADEACLGSKYRRITCRSDRTVVYAVREEEPPFYVIESAPVPSKAFATELARKGIKFP
jgi:hypothetical protein